jgi:transcriptional regulator with XRE-family HTH domain
MQKSEFNSLLGNYIRKLRQDKKLTQLDLASMMDINPQNISAIERGEVSPTLFWISCLCQCLEIELKDFISGFQVN